MNREKFLEDLLKASSPSGQEEAAVTVFDSYCKDCGFEHYYSDKSGNSVWSVFPYDPKKETTLISGHIDQVSAIVSRINDDGLISFKQAGGICLKSLISSHVDILGRKGIVHGIVAKKALHLETEEERKSAGKFTDYKIDVGEISKESVMDLGVYVGCLVVYRPDVNLNFGHPSKICSTSLDDKLGVFIACEVGREYKEQHEKSECNILIGAMTQEEVGEGAQIVAHNLNPDYSIDIDCTWADSGLGMNLDEVGDIKLGSGPVIAFGADKNRKLCQHLVETAESEKIKYQLEATRNGGTNTWKFYEVSRDCAAALISYPLRGMHSSTEVCSWIDIENCIKLITKSIE